MDTRFSDILEAFSGSPILVVGDIMLDEYIWGEVRRISPEAPVPVVEMRRRTYAPGGAANAAANVVSLGGQPLLGGVIGQDYHAGKLTERLSQLGIAVDGLVVDKNRPTTTKTRIVAHSQQMVRLDSEHASPLPAPLEEQLLHWVEQQLPKVAACIVSDYAKGVSSPQLARRLIELARAAGKPVVIDPKGADCTKYRGATLLKPNLQEAERLSRQEIADEASLLHAGNRLLEVLAETAVLVTRGSAGMSLFRKDRQPVHIPSVARDIFDVTGAGDTVGGALAMALAAGATLEQAAYIANHAAGIVVGKVGTATATLDELRGTFVRYR